MLTKAEYDYKVASKAQVEAKLFWAEIEAECFETPQEYARIKRLHAKAEREWEKARDELYLFNRVSHIFKGSYVMNTTQRQLAKNVLPFTEKSPAECCNARLAVRKKAVSL